MRKVIAVLLATTIILTASIKPTYAQFDLLNLVKNFFSKSPPENTQVAGAQERLVPPDLKLSNPEEIEITNEPEKTLRFNTSVLNDGKGDFRIIKEESGTDNEILLTQVLEQEKNEPYWHELDIFTSNSNENSWDMDEFIEYSLWSIGDDDVPKELLATTKKSDFCLYDEEKIDAETNNDQEKDGAFKNDCDDDMQGISSGWSTTFQANSSSQKIDISSIPNGEYALILSINPYRRILESNYENNINVTFVEITDTTATIVE